MASWRDLKRLSKGYASISVTASACAFAFATLYTGDLLPVIGRMPLPQITIVSAIIGYPLLIIAQSRLTNMALLRPIRRGDAIALVGLGAILAVPPVIIDIALPFPHDINILPPESLLFYPAIALVAEVVLHLAPLALLAAAASRSKVSAWIFVPVVFVEPSLQAYFSLDEGLQAWLVFGNVSLVSAAQIWVFRRYGFSAMFGLRLTFYFFWHVIWGYLRLQFLF